VETDTPTQLGPNLNEHPVQDPPQARCTEREARSLISSIQTQLHPSLLKIEMDLQEGQQKDSSFRRDLWAVKPLSVLGPP
jgi:hypothetical protein